MANFTIGQPYSIILVTMLFWLGFLVFVAWIYPTRKSSANLDEKLWQLIKDGDVNGLQRHMLALREPNSIQGGTLENWAIRSAIASKMQKEQVENRTATEIKGLNRKD